MCVFCSSSGLPHWFHGVHLQGPWHVKQHRIRAHLFLAVLAYRGVQLLRTLLWRHGIHTSWAGIRNRLAIWIRVTTTETKAGELITIRQDTRSDAGEAEVTRAVGLEPRLHGQRRRTRPRRFRRADARAVTLSVNVVT